MQSHLTFTDHIQKKKQKALSVIAIMMELSLVSIGIALKIYSMKSLQIVDLSYGCTSRICDDLWTAGVKFEASVWTNYIEERSVANFTNGRRHG